MSRGEWRTEQGWHRFDRVAFIVSLLLLLALLIVWFSGLVADETETPETVIASVENSEEVRSADSSDERAAQEPAAVEDKPGDPADAKDSDSSAPSVTDASKTDTNNAADNSQSDAPQAAANAETDAGKSLASQDPARQATFERIPKYLDQPIGTGSGTGSATESAVASTEVGQADQAKAADTPTTLRADAEQAQGSAADRLPTTVLTGADGPKVTPILELRSADGALTIDGIVSSDSLRASLLKAGLTAYGMRNLNNRLAVNAAVAPFEWSGDAADLILLVGGPESETTLRIDGNTVTLAGEVPELQDKQARALAAQQFFGTRARVDNRLRVVAANETDAQKQASTEKLDVDALGKKEPSTIEAGNTRREQPLAAVEPVNGDNKTSAAADLAEGGPGQVDSVTLLPSGLPKRIARGDCPKVATSVLIPFGSATVDLTEAARAALDQLAPCLSRRNYLVGGHTDNRGSPANNRALSKERAQAVVDYLVEAGVPARRLTAVGYGEARPIISNRSERGRARNRRVDFRFKR